MPVIATPDVVGAVIARLRAATPVTALTGTRISGALQDAWPLPAYAVVVSGGRGGAGEIGPATYEERLDLECYGPDARTAAVLAATARAYLLDELRVRGVAWSAGATRVSTVRVGGGPIFRRDPDTGWPSYVLSVLVRFSGVES